MKRLIFLLAGMFVAAEAVAATVTVTPPSYTVQPPKFSFTLPDSIGGPAGASVKSAAITNGHLILTLSTGATLDAGAVPVAPAPDLSGITSQITGLQSALTALQAQVATLSTAGVSTGTGGSTGGGSPTPPPVTLADPCASMNGQKWSTLTIDNTMSISAALACANPGFNLTLKDGLYNQVAHVGLDGAIHGMPGHADRVVISGQGGCTVDQNNGGGCSTRLAWGKGVFHFSVDNFDLSDLTLRDGGSNANGNHDGQAGLYIDQAASSTPGTFTVKHVILRHNENGAFSNGANSTTHIVFIECDFLENGTDGGSHSGYLAGGLDLTFTNIHDYGSNQGNNQKSRVSKVTYNGGWNKSVQGRWIECADGCNLTVNGGQFIGNNCCQNMFGNGTESTSKGPGNTVWHGPSEIWLFRATDFSNAGSFTADANVVLHLCGGSAFNDKGGAITGWSTDGTCQTPADPPLIATSGTM